MRLQYLVYETEIMDLVGFLIVVLHFIQYSN